MTLKTALAEWQDRFAFDKKDDGRGVLIRDHDPLDEAELFHSRAYSDQNGFASSALWQIVYAYKLALFEPNHPYVREFALRALRVAQIALKEGPFIRGMVNDGEMYRDAYVAKANARCEIAAMLAESLLNGTALDALVWIRAAEGYVAYSKVIPKGHRGQHDQSDYLFAVLALLLAGEIEQAVTLFKPKKGFKATHNTHALMYEVTFTLHCHGHTIPHDHPVREHFSEYFDAWRRPGMPTKEAFPNVADLTTPEPDFDLYRICLALLKGKYFSDIDESFEWARTLQYLIAESA